MPKLRPTFRLPLSILGVVALLFAMGVLAPHAEGVVRAPGPTAARAEALPIGQRPSAAATADSLPRDPALTVGTLPNGTRYYIRVNKSPAKRAFLWLAVNAGSMQEDDDQQGFAHFLEHMAFNGTKHFPGNKLIDFVEESGMEFGADLNAYTSFDETVYQLQVPTDDPTILRQGLQVLEDWAAGGITIDSAEVVAERGVVLGEWRSRLADTASKAVQEHSMATFLGAGSRYVQRYPIGLPQLLERAEPGPIRRFYKDWYRPDLMAVIAVGDFDPREMERQIRARFGPIPAVPKGRPRPFSAPASSAEPVVSVYKGNVPPLISILWRQGQSPVASEAEFRQRMAEQLLLERLQQRFAQLRDQPGRPFFGAGLGRAGLTRAASGYMAQMVAHPDSLESGLVAMLTEVERVAQHGVPAAQLERQKTAILRKLERAVASADAYPSARLVREYTQHYLTGEGPLLSAQQELTLARRILPGITPATLAETARFWRAAKGRAVLVMFPQFANARPPTRESILALLDSVARTPIAPESDSQLAALDAPLLATLPKPGRITGERQHARAGITEWTLSNGARVLLKPSRSNPDELFIRATSPGGFSVLDDSLFFTPGRLVAKIMTEAAGVGEHDRTSLQQQLATTGLREFRVAINYTEEEIALGGSPMDSETLFQLLYLQFTAPKLDTAALVAWQGHGAEGWQAYSEDQVDRFYARGNPRLAPPPLGLVSVVDVEQALAVYRDRFGDAADFTFIIVGAVTPQQVRPLIERYVASLPAAGRKEQPKDPEVRPVEGLLRQTMRAVEVPRATTMMLFNGLFPSSPSEYLVERQRLAVLSDVLRVRLRNKLREELGATYGVGVQMKTYHLPQEHYRVGFQFDAAPERIDEMIDVFTAELDSVRSQGATSAELARVATVNKRRFETRLQQNRYWLSTIQLYDRLGIPLDQIVVPSDPRAVTPAVIRAAAERYLPRDSYVHMTYLPKDSTSGSPSDTTAKP